MRPRSSRWGEDDAYLHCAWQADQNAFVKSLNGRFRDECLNEHLFQGFAATRRIIEAWRLDYNDDRPHTSLGGLTPNEFAARPKKDQTRKVLVVSEGTMGARSRSI
ncbi:hypothetical protein C2U72_18605 [Prosthecomicrobium hirschii]|nr:hypothetical protein C2U72_18605 [Prosthecomicrobium hirschii]